MYKSAKDADIPLRYECLKGLSNCLKGAGRGIAETTAKELLKIAKYGIADKLALIKSVSAEVSFIDGS
jgi:hypothetical protein